MSNLKETPTPTKAKPNNIYHKLFEIFVIYC
jgi:hypothetical protein